MGYVFERDFDQEVELEAETEARLKRACYTPEDLAAAMELARSEGLQDGHEEGRREAFAEAEETDRRRQTEAIEMLAGKVAALVDGADAHAETLEQQMLSFVLAVFEKLAPELIQGRAFMRAEAEVRAAMAVALGTASLKISLPPDVFEVHGEMIEEAARSIGHDGRIEVYSDETLVQGDARVEWDNGFMEYSFNLICNRILTSLKAASLLPGLKPDEPEEE